MAIFNDIIVSDGKEEGEFTTIEFKRSLNTGDKFDISTSQRSKQDYLGLCFE